MIHLESVIIQSSDEYSKVLIIVELEENEADDIEKAFKLNCTFIPCDYNHDCCGCICRLRVTKITQLDDNVYSALITYKFNV